MVLRTKPSVGMNVSISGEAKLELTTDTHGHFEAERLVPGNYMVEISTPLDVWPNKSQSVEVVERGCAIVRFRLNPFSTPRK